MTHYDKKPRGKVGGSAISVYQALLHPLTESLGTRLSAGEPYDVDQLVVKYYCSCVNCGFWTLGSSLHRGREKKRNGGIAEWRNGGIAEWRNSGMAEWRNSGMVE